MVSFNKAFELLTKFWKGALLDLGIIEEAYRGRKVKARSWPDKA